MLINEIKIVYEDLLMEERREIERGKKSFEADRIFLKMLKMINAYLAEYGETAENYKRVMKYI